MGLRKQLNAKQLPLGQATQHAACQHKVVVERARKHAKRTSTRTKSTSPEQEEWGEHSLHSENGSNSGLSQVGTGMTRILRNIGGQQEAM